MKSQSTIRFISSFAILKILLDKKKDYLNIFVPFIATLISKKKYNTIDIKRLIKDFEIEFGFEIPYHPMKAILNRSKIVEKNRSDYIPNWVQINIKDFSEESENQERKLNKLIKEFSIFSKDRYKRDFTEDYSTKQFLNFLEFNYLEVIKRDLDNLNKKKEFQFITNDFILYCDKSEPDLFNFIVDFCCGYCIKNIVLMHAGDDIDNFNSFKNVDIYFDTGFIFRLIGVDSQDRSNIYLKIVNELLIQQANLYIFSHTYDELMQVLEGSKKWLEYSIDYDHRKASITTIYFRKENRKVSDVDLLISNLPSDLKKFNIKIKDTPMHKVSKDYPLDITLLEEIIIETYKKTNIYFDKDDKIDSIRKDIKSISAICRLRELQNPTNFETAKYIFVTTSNSLFLANKEYENEIIKCQHPYIHSTVTDNFLGTMLWLNHPTKLEEVNKKRIVSDCSAALQQTDQKLLKKYIEQVEKDKNENKIDEKQYILLKNHHVCFSLLNEKTRGDSNNFKRIHVNEILSEITNKEIKNLKKNFEENKKKYITQHEKDKLMKDLALNENLLEEYNDFYKTIKSTKDILDKKSIKKRKYVISTWILANIIYFLILVFPTIKYGWDKTEPYIFFIGLFGIISSWIYLSIKAKKITPLNYFKNLENKIKNNIYNNYKFDINKYNALNSKIENLNEIIKNLERQLKKFDHDENELKHNNFGQKK